MTLFDYLNENWMSVMVITFFILSAGFLYKRFINNSDLFENFECIKDPKTLKDCRETIYNKIEYNPINCSNYIIDKSPISNLYRINEDCHSSNSSDHAKWSCFYRYILQKNALEDPQNMRGLFKTDYPIFYRV
jgi:hypothetical protein